MDYLDSALFKALFLVVFGFVIFKLTLDAQRIRRASGWDLAGKIFGAVLIGVGGIMAFFVYLRAMGI